MFKSSIHSYQILFSMSSIKTNKLSKDLFLDHTNFYFDFDNLEY